MIAAILGKKVGMTRVYDANGAMVPGDGHRGRPVPDSAGQDAGDGWLRGRATGLRRCQGQADQHGADRPHSAKTGVSPKRFVREIRLTAPTDRQAGQAVSVALFTEKEIKYVDVAGVTKGKGFQGVMKRWGFGGQCSSHGTERKHRSAGSIASYGSERGGAGGPKKGKHMAGHMGDVMQTTRSLKVLRVIPEHNLLVVSGSIPGPNGGYVVVRQAVVPPRVVPVKAAPTKKGAKK